MASHRKSAVVAGIFFVAAAAAAIAGLALYDPVLNDPRYVLESTDDTRVLLGAFFEIVTALAVIGTGVTLYPIVKRQNEGVAIGYVAGRTLEAVMIVVGLIALLSVVTLTQDSAGPAGSVLTTGEALVAIHDWTFLLGPGFAIGVNTLMLAYLMYRSGLVPRPIAMIGLVGGPLVFASSTAVLFGAYDQVSEVALLAALPVFAWEMSLAVWLIAKGFKAPAAASARSAPATAAPVPA